MVLRSFFTAILVALSYSKLEWAGEVGQSLAMSLKELSSWRNVSYCVFSACTSRMEPAFSLYLEVSTFSNMD